MKKFIRQILCFSIILQMFMGMSVFVNAENEEIIDSDILRAMYFLRELDIIAEYEDYTLKTEEEITRAEFAEVVGKALGIETRDVSSTYYYDVPLTHYAVAQINGLSDLGFINGVGDTRFNPDVTIKTVDACKILLNIMGYSMAADVAGGYPKGYINTAMNIKIVDVVSDTELLTRGKMLKLVFEAMQAPMYVVESADGNSLSVKEDKDMTILKKYRDMYLEEGTVDGVNGTSFDGAVLKSSEYVAIDGNVYKSRIDLSAELGEKIEYILYQDEDEDGEVICYMNLNETEVINISADQFERFDEQNYKLYYTNDNGTVKNVTLKRGVELIYNGGLITENVSDRLNTACNFKIIKTDGVYDRVIAKHKENYVVKNVDIYGELINNSIDVKNILELRSDDREYISIKTIDGKEISINEIGADNTLSVYESYYEAPKEYGDYLEIIVSTSTVNGEIQSVGGDSGYSTVVIDGKEYKTLNSGVFKVGDVMTVYIDADGEAVYAKKVIGNEFGAYLMKGYYDWEKEFVEFKMMKENGSIVELKCRKKIQLDGTLIDSDQTLIDMFKVNDPKFDQQLAIIKTNDNEEIISIDTAEGPQDDGTLIRVIDNQGVTYKNSGYIGADNTDVIAIDSNTIFFRTPPKTLLESGNYDDDDYSIGRAGLEDNSWVTLSAFKTQDSYAVSAKYVVAEAKAGANSQPWPIIVDSKIIKLNKDNEAISVLIGYDGASKIEIPIPNDVVWKKKSQTWAEGNADALKKGMVVVAKRNVRGEATEIDLIYDYANRSDYYNSIGYNDMGNEIGIVEDVTDTVLAMRMQNGRMIASKATDAQVMIVDGEEIRSGTIAEAKVYSVDNTDYSDAVVFQYQRWPVRIYIFK